MTTSDPAILRYQQKCYAEYASDIGLPRLYKYPTGNPIRPVPPVQTVVGRLMIIGAYPSARFESRKSPTTKRWRVIPVADNLQPFGEEVYFDGKQVRRLESGAGLREFLLDPLSVRLTDCWVTDLVKVFLYKPEHADSCGDAVPGFKAPVLRTNFMNLGRNSLKWIQEECRLCKPGIIITLGEEVARIVSGSTAKADELLIARPSKPEALVGFTTFHCPHPDACRRSPKWRDRMKEITGAIAESGGLR